MADKTYKVYRYWIDLDGREWSYVGYTSLSLNKRAGGYTGCKYIQDCPKFGFAIETYGWDNFQREVLEEVSTRQEAQEKELYYIQKFNSITQGFNENPGIYHTRAYRQNSLIHPKNRTDVSKPVLQFNRDGILLNRFPSVMEAARQLMIPDNGIRDCCKHRLHVHTFHNFVFQWET